MLRMQELLYLASLKKASSRTAKPAAKLSIFVTFLESAGGQENSLHSSAILQDQKQKIWLLTYPFVRIFQPCACKIVALTHVSFKDESLTAIFVQDRFDSMQVMLSPNLPLLIHPHTFRLFNHQLLPKRRFGGRYWDGRRGAEQTTKS